MSTSSPSQDQRESAAEVLEGGLDIDLAEPPTRADLAMPDGRRRYVLELAERESFDVTVRFTDGHVLRTPASTVDVTSDGTHDPTSMVVRRTGLSPAELETTLRDAVTSLDADAGRVDAYLAAAPSTTEGDSDLMRSIPTDVGPSETLSIEPIVTALEGRISIDYSISWSND